MTSTRIPLNQPASTVRVQRTPRGTWEVIVGDDHAVECDTLEDARRVAADSTARGEGCMLVVLDAYHRVTHRG